MVRGRGHTLWERGPIGHARGPHVGALPTAPRGPVAVRGRDALTRVDCSSDEQTTAEGSSGVHGTLQCA